ncbi:MAG: cadmium-translocating P-type ATPase [Actinobacteria bacterium]|nr:cadmium-translocating P-type ATPase [Actinomycetota bacterium]
MREKTIKLDIPLLLPQVKETKDQCIQQLQKRIMEHRGFHKAHIKQEDGKALLCLHYDPNLISLDKVRRLAEDAGAEISRQYEHEILHITGMDCANCAGSIEHILKHQPGTISVSVNYAAEKMRIEYDTQKTTHQKIVSQIRHMGYGVEEEKQATWLQENWELILALLSGLSLGIGFVGEKILNFPFTASISLYVLAYICGGFDATRHGLKAVRHLRFDIDFLMVVAAVGAAILGQWPEGALLLFLFSLGHSLEHYAMDRARHAIQALGQITPKTARVRRDGAEMELDVDELQRGDVVIVRPGERVPIDGQILDGKSAVDESPITGESVPVEKSPGEKVFAGAVNGDGVLEIKVTRLAKDTTLARIVQMVEEAQTQKSPVQLFTEKFERIFVPVILIGVVLVIFIPPLISLLSWKISFLRAMAVLVAASPCALAIATPAAILAGIAQAGRNGVLIKGGVHLENLGALRAIAFDKTGTITRGKPEVTSIIPLNNMSEDELLRIAAAVESRSNHPLARAILQKAQEKKFTLAEADNVQDFAGKGIQGKIDGKLIAIGNLKLFTEAQNVQPPDHVISKIEGLEENGNTTMLVRVEKQFVGIVALADRPRENAQSSLQKLRKLGIRVLIMLTGDNERVAAAISRQVQVSEFKAGLLPEEKVAAVRDYLKEYGKIAMVGDGVNDAPAMANATVGIAMGAGGTDVALETADIALMSDDLSRLPFAVALSRKSRRIIMQNLAVSLGVIALLIPFTLSGIAGIGIAIVFHESSTLVVVANALRLLNFKT